MTGFVKSIAASAILALGVSSVAAAKPPLREVAEIDDVLFQVAVANVIRKRCASLDARMVRAYSVVSRLKREAQALGYTNAEIDAYVDSDAEKQRMIERGEALFAARGVDPDNPDDLCRMGREEIAKNSPVGSLLKAK